MAPGGQGQTFDASDVRSAVAQALDERQRQAWLERRKEELLKAAGSVVNSSGKAAEETSNADTLKFVGAAFLVVTVVSLGSVYGIMWVVDSFQ